MKRCRWILSLVVVQAATAFAETYYVDQQHPMACDTNAGAEAAPFKTIQKAADVAMPGDIVKVKPGRYREGVAPANFGAMEKNKWVATRITYEAVGGEVILDGSRPVPVDDWTRADGRTDVYATLFKAPDVIDYCQRNSKLPEPLWVFADDQLVLPNVVERKTGTGAITKGLEVPEDGHTNRWYFDKQNGRLYVNLGGRKPGTDAVVEVSSFYHAFGYKPLHYTTLRGFVFQRYSHRAVDVGGSMAPRVEDCLFRFNQSGVSCGRDGWVKRCTFLDQENVAIEAGVYNVIEENLIVRFWRDTFKTHNIYASPAIVSFANGESSKTIRNNVIVDEGAEGYTGCGGFWPDMPNPGNVLYGNSIARIGVGMYIEYASMGAVIAWNVIEDTKEGIHLRHNAGNLILENYIARMSSHAFIMGSTTATQAPLMKYNFFSGNYIEDCRGGFATGAQAGSVNRQDVNVADGNIYNLGTNQTVAVWADKRYATLEEFRAGTGMETHGRTGRLSPEELGLVTFRTADADQPWTANAMIGNPHLDRMHWNRGDWVIPYFFEPGTGDGGSREWLGPSAWTVRVGGPASDEPEPRGIRGSYLAAEPFDGCVQYWSEKGAWPDSGYMREEDGLSGRGATPENQVDGRLMVLSRGPEPAGTNGLGWYSVSLPTAPGAVMDIGFWMQAKNVKAATAGGGAVTFVEWSDYTRTRLGRSFVLGRDDEGKDRLPKLVSGDFGYSRIEGTVTAPDWAKRFRLFMGLRSATGVLQFDDIDTIRTRPGNTPADAKQGQPAIPPTPLEPANLTFSVIDLSKFVNRSLADDVDDDGKGGWSDQGSAMDMRGIGPGDKTYEKVPFRILAPLSCVALRSPKRNPGELPEHVSIPVGTKADMVYFLHGGAWLNGGLEHWRYAIQYEDGTSESIPIIGGKNIRDWTDAPGFLADPEGAWRAFAAETTGGAVFVQQSVWVLEWKNPHPTKAITTIDFAGSGNGVPILLGITCGGKK